MLAFVSLCHGQCGAQGCGRTREGHYLEGRVSCLAVPSVLQQSFLSPCLLALQYILSVDRANLNKELLTGGLSLLFANPSNTLFFAGDLGFAP